MRRPASRGRRIGRLAYAGPLLGLVALAGGPPTPDALAALADWLPVLASYHSHLTLNTSYATNGVKTDKGADTTSSRQAFRESLSLNTVSYVYHPNLLIMGLSVSTSRDQSKVLAQGGNEGSTAKSGFESYDLEGTVLRNKPYTLSFFSVQDKPFNSSLAESTSSTTQKSGAQFLYNQRVYRLKAKYKHSTRDSGGGLSTIDDYDAFGTYMKPKLGWLDSFSATGMARHQTNTTVAAGGEGRKATTQIGTLSNQFGYRMFHFGTNLNAQTATLGDLQQDATQGDSDSISFSESIGADLPWNLTANLGVGIGSQKSSSGSSGTRSQSSTGGSDRFSFNLTNTLYDSLTTQLAMSTSSSESSRTDRLRDSSGAVSESNPVQGLNDNDNISLRSRYVKKLPFDGQLTGELATRANQSIRSGISSTAEVFTGIQDNAVPESNKIRLQDTVDTGATISVDVLRVDLRNNPDDACKEMIINPHLENPACWLRLENTIDYTVNQPTALEPQPFIEIGDISDNPGFAYDDFLNPDVTEGPTHGPFIFRVIYYLRAVDAKSQFNLFDAGITFFQMASASYQHSETTQEGSAAGRELSPTVTRDSATLGLAWQPFAAGATKEWTKADRLDTLTRYWISYHQSKTFFKRLAMSLNMVANTAMASTDIEQGETADSTTENYSCTLNSAMPIPYLGAALTVTNTYTFTKGSIVTLELNSDGVYVPTQDLGIKEQAIFRNSIGLSKAFTIPWIKFVANSYLRYLLTTKSGDAVSDQSTLAYGVSAARGWRLGATHINLNIKYANREETFNIDGTTQDDGTQRSEERNNASVVLTLIRQLF